MAAPDLVNISGLMDDAKCFAFVRQHRWPKGLCCPGCGSFAVTRRDAHLLLQIRCHALDGTLRPLFERWYPGLANDNPASAGQAAAA